MEPVRTCIGCRERADKSLLLRIVSEGSRIVADPSATRQGRGAWLHPSIDCYRNAVRRRAFARALRMTGGVDTAQVETEIRQEQAERHMDEK